MKSLVLAAAAVCAAGMLMAQGDSQGCCTWVYDFKATIKNSNDKQVVTKSGSCKGQVVDTKVIENNTLIGWLVLGCGTTCCGEGNGNGGTLVVYRQNDKRKLLYVIPANMWLADQFIKGLDNDCAPIAGTDAEGGLQINPNFGWLDTMAGFFDDPEIAPPEGYATFDVGFTTFVATGFGKMTTSKPTFTPNPDNPCAPPITIPGCTALDTLSGCIVGAMYFDFACNPMSIPLCVAAPFSDPGYSDDFQDPAAFNAVADGDWSIRLNHKISGCVDSLDAFLAEIQVGNLKNYTVVNLAD